RSHKLRRLLHTCRRLGRIRFAVTDHVTNEHRSASCSRGMFLSGGYYTLTKQICMRGGSAKRGIGGCFMFAAFVEAEPLAVNFEQAFGGFPVLALAAHAFAEHRGIEFSAARVADAIHHAICFGRQILAQTLFEIWCDAARQAQHVDESLLRSRFFRAL